MDADAVFATILVIDDDPELRGTLAEALQEAGYIVATAHDGESALALLGSIVVDLILVDVLMPGIGGLEFIERWSRTPGAAAPVVLMTGSRRIDALPAGCVGQLRKPFSLPELFGMIRSLVD